MSGATQQRVQKSSDMMHQQTVSYVTYSGAFFTDKCRPCSFMLSGHEVARASTNFDIFCQCDGANGDKDNMNTGWGPLSLWTDTFHTKKNMDDKEKYPLACL